MMSSSLKYLLYGDYTDYRRSVQKVIDGHSVFEKDRSVMPDHLRGSDVFKEITFGRLGALANSGVFTLKDFVIQKDYMKYFMMSSVVAQYDLSLGIKMGVAYGLYGGSICNLGTKKHKYLLKKLCTMELPGCFAMTEFSHGSNVQGIQTTATFDPDTRTFIVNTPNNYAQKYWIGNASRHAQMASVFCRLLVPNETNELIDHGVHVVLVPIRNDKLELLPGVTAVDCGEKVGLQGVDNGRMWFDHIKVPYDNLLDRFSCIDSHGRFRSEYSDNKRFAMMLGELTGGRVVLAGGATAAAQVALKLAFDYSFIRRQFQPSVNTKEIQLHDYWTHKLRLYPLLALNYGMSFGCRLLERLFVRDKHPEGGLVSKELHVLSSGIKAMASWLAMETIQTCRETCGGNGFSALSRFGELRSDLDICTTFEGDNTVLLQQVGKHLVSKYSKNRNALISWIQLYSVNMASRLTVIQGHLRGNSNTLDFLENLFLFRERSRILELLNTLNSKRTEGKSSFACWNESLDCVNYASLAYTENVLLKNFIGISHSSSNPLVTDLCSLFAIELVERDPWFSQQRGFRLRSKRLHKTKLDLIETLSNSTQELLDAFEIQRSAIDVPMTRTGELLQKSVHFMRPRL